MNSDRPADSDQAQAAPAQGESLRQRLRRLRRDSERADAVASQDEPRKSEPRASVRERLARRGRRGLDAAAPDAGASSAEPADGELALGPPAGLVTSTGPDDEDVIARTTSCSSVFDHGEWTLVEVDDVDPSTFELCTGDAALDGLDLRDAVYLDTETSGLSGGAGTWVFLVGLGRFVDEGERFEVWQGFLDEPDGERGLLAEAAARIRGASAVVSFFGKSFDRHRLEDKMRLVGVEPPFDGKPHLDLFHPLRRLYRGAFEDSRLSTMERELCGFERHNDLSGAFAPAAWFDYLARRPHRLEGVFEHNLHDVRSLVGLAAHLGRVMHETRGDGRQLAGPAAERAAGLARSLWERGRRGEALDWIARARQRRDSRELRLFRADALRLTRQADEALAAYAELVAEPEDEATARCWVELAKLHEHARRDPEEALACCRRSRDAAERRLTGMSRARLLRELVPREARLASHLSAGAELDGLPSGTDDATDSGS